MAVSGVLGVAALVPTGFIIDDPTGPMVVDEAAVDDHVGESIDIQPAQGELAAGRFVAGIQKPAATGVRQNPVQRFLHAAERSG